MGRTKIDAAAAVLARDYARTRVNSYAEEGALGAACGRSSGNPDGARLTQARTVTEVYKARREQLSYEQEIGKLLYAADVSQAMAKCAGAMVRDLDQIQNYAEELVAIAAKDGVAGVRSKLKEIARNTRTVLANNMKLLSVEEQQKPEDSAS